MASRLVPSCPTEAVEEGHQFWHTPGSRLAPLGTVSTETHFPTPPLVCQTPPRELCRRRHTPVLALGEPKLSSSSPNATAEQHPQPEPGAEPNALAREGPALNPPGASQPLPAGSALLSPPLPGRGWVPGCASTPSISCLFSGAVFCLRSSSLPPRPAGEEQSLCHRDELPARGLAPEPLETRRVFPPPDWAPWQLRWSHAEFPARCDDAPSSPTAARRRICLKTSSPPGPSSACSSGR